MAARAATLEVKGAVATSEVVVVVAVSQADEAGRETAVAEVGLWAAVSAHRRGCLVSASPDSSYRG